MKREARFTRACELESVADAASRLGVSRAYLYRLIREDALDYYIISDRKYVLERDIDTLILKRVG